jgi:hypothetical protein
VLQGLGLNPFVVLRLEVRAIRARRAVNGHSTLSDRVDVATLLGTRNPAPAPNTGGARMKYNLGTRGNLFRLQGANLLCKLRDTSTHPPTPLHRRERVGASIPYITKQVGSRRSEQTPNPQIVSHTWAVRVLDCWSQLPDPPMMQLCAWQGPSLARGLNRGGQRPCTPCGNCSGTQQTRLENL